MEWHPPKVRNRYLHRASQETYSDTSEIHRDHLSQVFTINAVFINPAYSRLGDRPVSD